MRKLISQLSVLGVAVLCAAALSLTAASSVAAQRGAAPVKRHMVCSKGAKPLCFRVVGSCSINYGGLLQGEGRGFRPGGKYLTQAWYPLKSKWKGQPYTNLINNGYGRASKKGTTPGWKWNCELGAYPDAYDVPGWYRLKITEVNENDVPRRGRFVKLSFEVKP